MVGYGLRESSGTFPLLTAFCFLIMKLVCFIPTVIFCLFTGSKTGVLVLVVVLLLGVQVLVAVVCYGIKCPKL